MIPDWAPFSMIVVPMAFAAVWCTPLGEVFAEWFNIYDEDTPRWLRWLYLGPGR